MSSDIAAAERVPAGLASDSADAGHDPARDRRDVAALDLEYQAAVKRNDAQTMDRILHPDFAMVLGDGRVVLRDELLDDARSAHNVFEQQDEEAGTQAVRVWGDTAVVTAKLWVKGAAHGQPFERKLWFSDTYVRTETGWRYAFAQVSLRLPLD